jgi:hypothetical protein
MVLVAVACLGLTASGGRALADDDLVLSGKGHKDVSAAPGTSINKSGEGVAIVAVNDGKYTVSMDGPGTLYLVGMDDYSSVEVISKTGDGDLVWVPSMNPKAGRGPMVKGKIEGDGKIRSGTQKEVNDLRSKAAEPKPASRPGAGESARPSLQDWLVASARKDKPFDRLVRDYLAPAKGAPWEEWFDRAAFGR